jgi:outer membrane receptor protein involved in Fe transport
MATSIRILTGTWLLVFAICSFAQTDATGTQAEEDAKVLDPIMVTGYHLKRIDLEGPAPVVVFDRAGLDDAGVNTLEEFTRNLPINFFFQEPPWGANGQATFDLRGIGSGATLTLVNGLRMAPYAWFGASEVDVNAIPISAIERIEILKDGASAIYGADAIAGVVNIILRTDFDGMEVNAGYGISEHGDAEEFLADFVTGRDNGRGSFMFALSYFNRDPVAARDRDWSSDVDWSPLGGPNRRSIVGSPATLLRYDTFTWEADPACGTNPARSSVGESPWGPDFGTACRYNYNYDSGLLTGQERIGATLSGKYQLNSKISFFGDFFYTEMDADNSQAPAPIYGSPDLPTFVGLPYVPAEHPNNPFGVEGELAYRALEFDNRIYSTDSSTYRLALGMEGVWGDWDWKVTLLGSKSQVDVDYINAMRQTKFQEALLGRGGPEGNLWYNPFGFEPQNDPALIEWLKVDAESRNKSYERSADLLFSRIFGSLPGGPVGVAIGLQYREQELDQWADEHLRSGDLAGASQEAPVSADRDIFSAYVEFNLPVFESLEAQLAVRYEHYSDFGSTTNPKIALRWQPAESIMFRGSWSTSFLAPDFWQLYEPTTDWLFDLQDTVRCEYTGSPEDCDWRTYFGTYGGNPELDPEDGESWFAGLVWEPEFLPGFEFQLDFWKFKHKNRIEYFWPQIILDNGGDLGITREPTEPDGTPGRIIFVRQTTWNLDEFQTRGFDTTVRYAWQTDKAGDFQATLMHTYIDRWMWTETLWDDEGFNYAGKVAFYPIPRNRFNLNFTWDLHAHHAAVNVHYLGHWENSSGVWVDGVETDEPWDISSQTTLDLQYAYTFEKLRNARLRIGCTNCTGETPPVTFGVDQPNLDWRGRFYYVRWQQPIR